MSIKQVTVAALALLVGTAAMACTDHQDAGSTFQTASPYTAAPRSRAEVIADLEIYRKSGLAEMDSRDDAQVFGAAYQTAQARYQALRASPEFASLVTKIAKARGESVSTARADSGAVSQ